ncbi:MAG: ferrous iron transport protein B [Clostridia bacterium]|nr:ferrous iron transport protein B [Clostridia bacterium]
MTRGIQVRLIKAAPAGDPLEISLRGFSLSLRKSDAEHIVLVKKEAEKEFLNILAKEKEKQSGAADAILSDFPEDSQSDLQAVRLTDFVVSSFDEGYSGDSCRFCSAKANRSECNCPDTDADTEEEHELRIALAGNPNSGKTTLFNVLTGSREYVGNWPGVTVEKKEGKIQSGSRKSAYCTHGHDMTLVDLPGIYSLSPHTMEEMVARRFLTEEKPNAIINIVDATNLERNLYLTIQLSELEIPMIIALNMMDEVEKRGDSIDCKALSAKLGIPVVPISARSGKGVDELVHSAQVLLHVAHIQHHEGNLPEPDMFYDKFTHALHHELGSVVRPYVESAHLPIHFAEIKLLEKDEDVMEKLNMPDEVRERVLSIIDRYTSESCMGDPEIAIANSRYGFIEEAVSLCVKRKRGQDEPEAAEKLDRILTHKYLALPIFAGIILLIFVLTFSTAGSFLSDTVSNLIGNLTPAVSDALSSVNTAPWLISLICDGIISGVGGVLTFLPQIAILFTLLSLLEDSGYMARIAFIMDSTMRKIGLSGKAIIPLLMGFGCTVPAAMGARTMENIKDKRMTILLLPFMSCSAKLPIYSMMAGAFFGKGSVFVILLMYVIGVLCGILSGVLFKSTAFRSVDAQFLIELPPYRVPSARNVLTHVWERVKHFIVKAGTLIFLMSVVLWLLLNFDFSFHMVSDQSTSILGKIGSFIAPLFTPNGFPYWQAVVALFVGLMAKEAVVSSLAMFYGFSATASSGIISQAMGGDFTAASAFSFLVFVLLYTPCVAAVSTLSNELQSRKWAAFAVVYQVVFAYVMSTIAYFAANLLL